MDEHLRVLLGWARCHRAGEAKADEVHVWWAKLRSPNRVGPLEHAPDVLATQGQISGGVETHLYLTDYRSLYVARLEEITDWARCLSSAIRRPTERWSPERKRAGCARVSWVSGTRGYSCESPGPRCGLRHPDVI
jgi:hypothetical protein